MLYVGKRTGERDKGQGTRTGEYDREVGTRIGDWDLDMGYGLVWRARTISWD